MSDHTTDAPLKRCSRCKKEFPRTAQYFYHDKWQADGFYASCKVCTETNRVRKPKKRKPKKSYVERFWENVQKGADNECWLWTGHKSRYGYGVVRFRGMPRVYAHRLSWTLHFGPIPFKMRVCHHCDNTACINPAHLFLGTPADNTQDMVKKGRQAKGEKNGFCKLSDPQIEEIRQLHKEGWTYSELMERFPVSRAHVSLIVRYKTRKLPT